jgi:hypothetical protein
MHDQRLKGLRPSGLEATCKVLRATHVEWLEFDADRQGRALEISPDEISVREGPVHEQAHATHAREGFREQFQPFSRQLGAVLNRHSGDVRPGPRQARDETDPDRVAREGHHDWDG